MNDDLPRSYAAGPLQLVRAHPWSVAGTVLLTGLLLALYPTATKALLDSDAFNQNPVFFVLLLPAFATLAALPTVVPQTLVAVLAKRRVTVGRVLGLLAASTLVIGAQSLLFNVFALDDGEALGRILAIGIDLLTLLALGLLGLAIYPPPGGRNNVPFMVLGSVALAVIAGAQQWIGGVAYEPGPLSWTVGALTGVGWAIAALATPPPPLSPGAASSAASEPTTAA